MAERKVSIKISSEADLAALKRSGLAIEELEDGATDASEALGGTKDKLEDVGTAASGVSGRADDLGDSFEDMGGKAKGGLLDTVGGLTGVGTAAGLVFAALRTLFPPIDRVGEALKEVGASGAASLDQVTESAKKALAAIEELKTAQSNNTALREGLLKTEADAIRANLRTRLLEIEATKNLSDEERVRQAGAAELAATVDLANNKRSQGELEITSLREQALVQAEAIEAAEKRREEAADAATRPILEQQRKVSNLEARVEQGSARQEGEAPGEFNRARINAAIERDILNELQKDFNLGEDGSSGDAIRAEREAEEEIEIQTQKLRAINAELDLRLKLLQAGRSVEEQKIKNARESLRQEVGESRSKSEELAKKLLQKEAQKSANESFKISKSEASERQKSAADLKSGVQKGLGEIGKIPGIAKPKDGVDQFAAQRGDIAALRVKLEDDTDTAAELDQSFKFIESALRFIDTKVSKAARQSEKVAPIEERLKQLEAEIKRNR